MHFFELKISEHLNLNERDSRRMDRVISDVSEETGMEKQEILDFLIYGADKELSFLMETYDWQSFKKKIQTKLKK